MAKRDAGEGKAGAVDVRAAELGEIVKLRAAVLRPGQAMERARYEGDEAAGTRHVGAFVKGGNVGCVTFLASAWEGEGAWQLRGMAVAESWRGRGIGGAMVRFAEPLLRAEGRRVVWCNARIWAAGFYGKLGWTAVSGEFEVVGVGPHVRMVRRLG